MKALKIIVISFIIISKFFVSCFAETDTDSYSGTNSSSDTESNRIALIVNKDLMDDDTKDNIKENLFIYITDLKNEGYDPILKKWDLERDPAPRTVKGYLRGLYEDKEHGSLQGAVFIGDLPIARTYHKEIIGWAVNKMTSLLYRSDEMYISDGYYMDLVGKQWRGLDEENEVDNPDEDSWWNTLLSMADSLTPEILKKLIKWEELFPFPEIWVSRIVTSSLTELLKSSEGELVNAYLEKNHAYRTGQVVFPKQNLLYSKDEMSWDWLFFQWWDYSLRRDLSIKYPLKEAAPKNIDEFLKPLQNESYEILSWVRHGLVGKITIGSGDPLSSLLLTKKSYTNIATAFVFPISCLIGNYTEPGYFAGSYMFNKESYVLGMLTSTRPMRFIENPIENNIIDKFQSGSSLGLAFKESMNMFRYVDSVKFLYFIKRLSEGVKMIPWMELFFQTLSIPCGNDSKFILGDGTLKLQSANLVANEENSPKRYIKEKYPRFLEQEVLLNEAIQRDDKKTVESLLTKNRKLIDDASDEEGNTPLMKAVLAKNGGMVKLLLKYKPNLELKDYEGCTALFKAVSKWNIEIVQLLLDEGAKMDSKTIDGYNPIEMAINSLMFFDINNTKKKVVEVMLNKDSSMMEVINNKGRPLFIEVVSRGSKRVVEFLLNYKPNLELRDKKGYTALHHAAFGGNIEIIKLLLNAGARVDTKSNNGQTPWDIAMEKGHGAEVLDLLKVSPKEEKMEF